ncbi:hypothetical protein VIGAN_07190300, partial [Vigna angularis var. angularis]
CNYIYKGLNPLHRTKSVNNLTAKSLPPLNKQLFIQLLSSYPNPLSHYIQIPYVLTLPSSPSTTLSTRLNSGY